MFYTRQDLEEIENHSLAPYAVRSRDSKGRAYLDTGGWSTKPRSLSISKVTISARV
jgi:hypothetical protein